MYVKSAQSLTNHARRVVSNELKPSEQKEDNTIRRYETLVKLYLKPRFGDIQAKHLKPRHLMTAYGVLYVANVTEANVEEYQPGGYHPFRTITKGLITPAPVTVNRKGWLYVANDEQGDVVEFRPGSFTPSRRQVTKGVRTPIGLAYYPPLLPHPTHAREAASRLGD
ncbi:MAG: hypothetical protein WBX23_02515 [Candidatus Cybelea sp.]